MNIVYDRTTGEVLAENVPNYKLGMTFNKLVREGHNYDDLCVHAETPVDKLSDWR